MYIFIFVDKMNIGILTIRELLKLKNIPLSLIFS